MIRNFSGRTLNCLILGVNTELTSISYLVESAIHKTCFKFKNLTVSDYYKSLNIFNFKKKGVSG